MTGPIIMANVVATSDIAKAREKPPFGPNIVGSLAIYSFTTADISFSNRLVVL